jgi:hypothetical protein
MLNLSTKTKLKLSLVFSKTTGGFTPPAEESFLLLNGGGYLLLNSGGGLLLNV